MRTKLITADRDSLDKAEKDIMRLADIHKGEIISTSITVYPNEFVFAGVHGNILSHSYVIVAVIRLPD